MNGRHGTERYGERVLARYLERHAEPEATTSLFPNRYQRALVVPVRRESPDFLRGLEAALASSPGPNLGIVVVNEGPNDDTETRVRNRELIVALLGATSRVLRSDPGISLASKGDFDLLVVSRLDPGWAIPVRQGVGLARKIGVDLATRAYAERLLASPWVVSTDADATLDPATFEHLPDERASAVCFPFVHEIGDDVAAHEATLLVELELRYTVLGAHAAGSPYAFHTIGSSLAVHLESHAAARGFPRRAAGEDFHLLRKLAKLGPIEVPKVTPVRIRSRRSDRVPFGTGPSVLRLLSGEDLRLDDPEVFEELARWFTWLRTPGPFSRAAFEQGCPERTRDIFGEFLRELDFDRFAARLATHPLTQRRARLLEWFDGLRFQQLVHRLRAALYPKLPWREASARAGFVPDGAITSATSPTQGLDVLRKLESGLPRLRGPTTFDVGRSA